MKVSKITFAALSALTLISVSAQAQSTSDSMRWPMNGTSNTMPNDMPNGTPNSAPNSTGASTDPSFDWKKAPQPDGSSTAGQPSGKRGQPSDNTRFPQKGQPNGQSPQAGAPGNPSSNAPYPSSNPGFDSSGNAPQAPGMNDGDPNNSYGREGNAPNGFPGMSPDNTQPNVQENGRPPFLDDLPPQ